MRGAAWPEPHGHMNDRYSLTDERPSLFHVYSFVKRGVPGMALALNYSSVRRVLAPFVDVQGHCCYSSFHGLLRPADAFWVCLPH